MAVGLEVRLEPTDKRGVLVVAIAEKDIQDVAPWAPGEPFGLIILHT